MRGDRKRIAHKESRAGYVGSRTVKENNRQYKGPDRKKALKEEMKDLHVVLHFMGGTGKTFCGIYSDRVTAYPKEATCEKCKRSRNRS